MSKEEMYEIEREALNDPFLQDAIDGYRLQRGVDSHQLSILQQRLAKKIASKADDKKRRFYSWHRLTIGMAAAVLFLVASSLILFKYMVNHTHEKNTEVILMDENMKVQSTIMDNVNAVPKEGWEKFNEELNSELRDVKASGRLTITFEVIDGIAENLQISPAKDQELVEVLSNFMDQKVRWKGEKGGIILDIQK
ncbi:hypothetical protein [Sphingobacterium endophyticum]|uniref:hypothetical protein n=1 Tax=Sphingobacterium endophyticum TaxID=2546448 RepID=UPI0012E2E216|nr:hypothetical protein [Sphingobacterium endophyticum]